MGVLTYEDAPDNTVLQLLETNMGSVRVITKPASSALAPAPFYGTYYVDPDFTGTSTGSASNPFTTIAAAFAFAATALVTSGIVFIPQKTVTENVVFPTTGNWEIASLNQLGYHAAIIAGTVDITCTSTARRALTNLQVTGAVTGAAPTGTFSRFRVTNAILASSCTLTAAGTGGWRVSLVGAGSAGLVGLFGTIGATTVTGEVIANNFSFLSSLSVSGLFWAFNCTSGGTGPFTYTGAGAGFWRLFGTNFNSGANLNTSGGALTITVDGIGAQAGFWNGMVLGANVSVVTAVANGSDRRTLTNNLASQTLYFDYPIALVTVQGSLTLLVAGTAGTANLKCQYTDLLGVVQTKTVCSLNIASAAGTEAVGAVQFSKQQASGVAWLVDGIVTPGALSLSAAANLRIDR